MQALRKLADRTSTAASQLVSSRTDDMSQAGGRSKTATGFSNVRRRMYEQSLQVMGRSSATEDVEFSQRKASVLATEKQLQTLHSNFSKYLNSLRTLSGANFDLGRDISSFYEGVNNSTDAAVSAVTNALVSVDEGARRAVSASVLTIAGPLVHLRDRHSSSRDRRDHAALPMQR